MADNDTFQGSTASYPPTDLKVASDKVTYSGDANQSQQVVHIAGVTGSEGSKTVLEIIGTAGSASTGVVTVQGVASGTVIPVSDGGGALTVDGTVTAELSATDNAVLDAIAASVAGTVVVGDGGSSLTVDGSVTAVGAAAENAAVSGNPVLVGGRYDATPRTLGDGDAGAAALNASGHVLVEISAGAGSGGTSAADDADFTATSTSGTPVMGVYESTPTSVTDGDLGMVGVTQKRAVRSTLESAAGTAAFGTAGSAATPVLTVQGIASGTTLPVTASIASAQTLATVTTVGTVSSVTAIANALPAGTNAIGKLAANSGVDIGDVDVTSVIPGTGATNLGKAEDAAHSSDDVGVMALAVRKATTPADRSAGATDGDYEPLQVDGNGRLYTQAVLYNSSGTELTADTQGTQDGALGTITSVTGSMALLRASAAAPTGVSADDDAVLPWALRNGSLVANLAVGGTLVGALDDAAFTPGTSAVIPVGFQADETATDSVDEGDAGAARMTLDRKQIVTAQPHAAGGLSIFRSIDLDETEEEVKASAGCVYAMWVTNTATATRFIKFYNATAANVTVGTTTPVITIGIPGNTSDDIAGNFGPGGLGITFDTAISVAATTAVADADTGAPAANDVIVNIFYK